MKKYFIYFICALFCCSIYAQQKQQKIQIPADFIALIDSIHANPYLSFHEYPIRLPLNDSIAATSMYYLTDSLAQTRNYINKKLAARVVYLYVYYYRKEKSINTWQHDLITKLIMTELKYCYRYNIDSPIPILQSSFYTPEIIEKLKDFFAHSTYTQEEAEVIAMSFPPPYFVSDTLGYAALQHKKDSLYINFRGYNRSLHGEEEDLYFKKYAMISNAKDKGMSLEQYCDSLNREYYQRVANEYVGKTIDQLSSLLGSFAGNKVHAMAPFIESMQGKIRTISDERTRNMLARLNYKDYNIKQTDYYAQQIDSLSKVLSSITEVIDYINYDSPGIKVIWQLDAIFNTLSVIGTQEAYFTMAPLLLLKNRVKTNTLPRNFTVGINFYEKIANKFSNVPVPKCAYNIYSKYGDYADLIDLYSDGQCKKEIESYIPKAYQWMLDNKGKYELKNPEIE